MDKESNELFSTISSWHSFATQTSTSPSFIGTDGFYSNPVSDTASANNNGFKSFLKGGFLESTHSPHESNYPASKTSYGVQVTKTVKHKTCALDSRTCVLDNRISLDEAGSERASACFGASVVNANNNKPEKADRRLEKEISPTSKC